MKDQLPLLSYAVVRHLLVVVGIYRHLVVLSIIILGILQLPLEGNTVGAPQEITAEDAKPDSIATELIDRIQSLEVAPAPADTKKIAIHGSVYTPSLSPARGIVACWSLEKDGTAATFLGKIDTNIRGQFSIEIVTTVKPTSTLHIIAISFNHGIGWTQCNTTELATKRSHSIMLHDGSGSIEGTLLAPGNKPVAGFELSVHDIFEDQGGGISTNYFPIQYSTKSDDNGHFVIEGLPSKVYVLLNIQSKELISKQTIMPTSPGIPSPQSGTNQIKTIASGTEIKLFPRVELTGNVVDALGQPITDARIIASFSRAVTDEEGKYTLVRPDVSAWSVAEAATYVEQLIVQPPEKSRFVETILYVNPGHFSERTIKPCILKGEFLSGRLVSAKNGRPLAGISVQVVGKNRKATSGANGSFQLAIEPGQHEVQLSPDWMNTNDRSKFLADPNSKSVRRIKIVNGQPADLGDIMLDLDPYSFMPVKVKVVMSDGTPVADCRVEFAKSDAPGSVKLAADLVENESFVAAVKTDKNGIAVVQPASGWGKYVPDYKRTVPQKSLAEFLPNVLTATINKSSDKGEFHRWSGSAEFYEANHEIVEIALLENLRITSRVLLNERPLAGAMVRGYDSLAKVEPNQSVESDVNGIVEFFVEPVSKFRVIGLSGSIFKNIYFGLGNKDLQATDNPQRFVVPDIEVVSGTAEIHGMVIDEDGKPVVGAHVGCRNTTLQIWLAMLSNKTNGVGDSPTLRTRTDSDGKFAFSGLPDGVFPVTATDRKNETWKDKLRITEAVEVATGESELKILLRSMPKDQ